MTSSLRNSVHRRNHKERSQLAHRKRFGILEKHADYILRARDYHSKRDRITRLRQKAAERNKDEFYFSMVKEKTREGVHIKDRGNVSLPADTIKILKTQDENYVRTMRAAGRKKIEKIKDQLMAAVNLFDSPGLDGIPSQEDILSDGDLETLRRAGVIPSEKRKLKRTPKHIVFVSDAQEAQVYAQSQQAITPSQTASQEGVQGTQRDMGWKQPDSKKRSKPRSMPSNDYRSEPETDDKKPAKRSHKQLIQELSTRLGRDTQLRYAEREFEMQRLLMGKGGRQKLRSAERIDASGDEDEAEDLADAQKGKAKPVRVDPMTYRPRMYKWRLERKR